MAAACRKIYFPEYDLSKYDLKEDRARSTIYDVKY